MGDDATVQPFERSSCVAQANICQGEREWSNITARALTAVQLCGVRWAKPILSEDVRHVTVLASRSMSDQRSCVTDAARCPVS